MSISDNCLSQQDKAEWGKKKRISQQHDFPCAPGCAVQPALETIGGKWKPPVLCSLTANGASRCDELLRNVRGISNTMLSQTLKELEGDRLVLRRNYKEVPASVDRSPHCTRLHYIRHGIERTQPNRVPEVDCVVSGGRIRASAGRGRRAVEIAGKA